MACGCSYGSRTGDDQGDAGNQTAERLREAAEAGVPANSLWPDIKSAAAQVWKATVKVATVVAIVVAVIALFVGGLAHRQPLLRTSR